MNRANPYSINFGLLPHSFIERDIERDEIIGNFTADTPSCRLYMISGIRGSGKTVTMTDIENSFRKMKDWIVIDLNPETDLLEALAAELSNNSSTAQIFKDAKINLSALGLGFEIDGVPPLTSYTAALDQMLSRLSKKCKKILITIDEVSSNQNIKIFVSQFQIFLRKNYPVFMIMTGLHENIYNLQDEKTLTFLYRAPKIKTRPLNIHRIARNYSETFNLSDDIALKMAAITKGYPYAFQVLGYVCYKFNKPYDELLDEFDLYMEDYVYSKIWSELTVTDRRTLRGLCFSENGVAESIRKYTGQNQNQYNKSRASLIKKELIESVGYGRIDFTLPRFKEFILKKEDL